MYLEFSFIPLACRSSSSSAGVVLWWLSFELSVTRSSFSCSISRSSPVAVSNKKNEFSFNAKPKTKSTKFQGGGAKDKMQFLEIF